MQICRIFILLKILKMKVLFDAIYLQLGHDFRWKLRVFLSMGTLVADLYIRPTVRWRGGAEKRENRTTHQWKRHKTNSRNAVNWCNVIVRTGTGMRRSESCFFCCDTLNRRWKGFVSLRSTRWLWLNTIWTVSHVPIIRADEANLMTFRSAGFMSRLANFNEFLKKNTRIFLRN